MESSLYRHQIKTEIPLMMSVKTERVHGADMETWSFSNVSMLKHYSAQHKATQEKPALQYVMTQACVLFPHMTSLLPVSVDVTVDRKTQMTKLPSSGSRFTHDTN